MNIILFGAPGVGKGTQAARLGERLDIPHISTGAIFRAAIEAGTELGLQAKHYSDNGILVPDELTTAIALQALDDGQCVRGFILDGYPRNLSQAESLTHAMNERNRRVDFVIYVTAPEEEIVARMLKRGRVDDTEEVIKRRLEIYQNETAPVLDYFRNLGLVTEVNGLGEIDEIQERILSAIGMPVD